MKPRIIVKAKIRGKNEVETEFQANSGADFIVLPKEIIEKIKPKKIESEVQCLAVGGKIIKSPLYEVEIEVEDPKKKLKRSCKCKAIVAEIGTPLLSFEAMAKLKMVLDPETGGYELKK